MGEAGLHHYGIHRGERGTGKAPFSSCRFSLLTKYRVGGQGETEYIAHGLSGNKVLFRLEEHSCAAG